MDGLEHNYIDLNQVHICRSFASIRGYTKSRIWSEEGYVSRDKLIVS